MDIWGAALNGNIKRIEELLAQGVDINFTDPEYGSTPLMFAAERSNTSSSLETVKFLLDNGADINFQNSKNGHTALFYTSAHTNDYSSLDTVKLLLDRGADINKQNKNGYTALTLTVERSNATSSLDTVKLLLDRGADITITYGEQDATILMLAVQYAGTTSSSETVELLLDRGADPNIRNKEGNFALIFACRFFQTSSLETVKLLLDRGADPNLKNNLNKTPLFFAVRHASLDAVKLLLDRGADPNILSSRGRPLSYAGEYGSLDMVRLLLDKGADPFINVDCRSEECFDIINKARWDRLSNRDKELARKYNLDIPITKDVWLLIMRHKRQQQLCSNLQSEKHKGILKYFALELEIPLENIQNLTKVQLCGLISRQLLYRDYGKVISEREKDRQTLRKLVEVASKYGIDTNRPLEEIITNLSRMLK